MMIDKLLVGLAISTGEHRFIAGKYSAKLCSVKFRIFCVCYIYLYCSLDLRATDTDGSLRINPYKPFIGFANAGYEKRIACNISVMSFAEMMLRNKYLVGNWEHPRFNFQIGTRLYFMKNGVLSGSYFGAFTGISIKDVKSDQAQGGLLGMEVGYKIRLGKRKGFFLDPRGLIHWNSGGGGERIGIEVHLGFLLFKRRSLSR